MGKRHGLTNKNTEQDNNNNYRNGSKETGIYRNHKDGVAYKLFSGKKESLSLYNSIMRYINQRRERCTVSFFLHFSFCSSHCRAFICSCNTVIMCF